MRIAAAVFTEISARDDKQLWFIEAHLRANGADRR